MATFDERAATWDTPDRVERARAIAELIRGQGLLPRGARTIEVGAGTGLLGLALADHLGELVLADSSVGMLETADRKIAERGLDHVRTQRFDVVDGSSAIGAPFDAVLSLLMLHHVEDTAAALGAMHRLLAPGGILLAADLDTEDGSFHDPSAEGIHHHGFDRAALGALARDVGFEDVAFQTAFVIRDGGEYPLFLLAARRGGD
ncbi:MAG: class I SAM-dependent methyltransferase [Chloroflexi bacterium]|nr:class I SAM-dependent methyltransferase [Chloroflexota bacterium]